MTDDAGSSAADPGGSAFGPDAGGPPRQDQQPPGYPPPQYGQQYPPPPQYAEQYPPPPQYGQQYPPPQYAAPGYTPPINYGYAPPRPNEGHAVAALILSIASFVVCPLVAAVVALVLAGIAKRNILASANTKDGLGMVTAARVIAWINIALSLIFLALIVVGVVVGSHVAHNDPSGVV